MELYIKDRIYFPQLLPQQGNFMEFNLKREIMKKVRITEKEKEEFKIVEDREHGRITWDSGKDLATPLHVDFTQQEIDYIRKGCEQYTESEAPAPDDFWVLIEKVYNQES